MIVGVLLPLPFNDVFDYKVEGDAVAVDMESAALAQVCYMYRVPFLSLRVISDTPGVANHAAQYENFWETAGEESFKVLQKLLHPDAGSRKVSAF